MADLSSMSDDELQAIASGQQAAPPAQDMSRMTDMDLQNIAGQGKLLSNVPGEGLESSLAKGTTTAALQGVTHAPALGMMGDVRQLQTYLSTYPEYWLGQIMGGDHARPFSDIYNENVKLVEPDKRTFMSQLQAPMGGEEIYQRLIAPQVGQYEPETEAGKLGMAGVSAVTGGVGFNKANTLFDAAKQVVKHAPLNFTAGVSGEAAAEATGDPLAGLVAGVVAPTVGGKIVSGVTNPVKQYLAPAFKSNQETLAGQRLREQATSPQEAMAAGAMPPRPEAYGPETFGETAIDPGLLQAQKAAFTSSPEFAQAVKAMEAERNAARLGSVEALAPEGANVMRPSEVLAQHQAVIDAAEQQSIQALEQRAADLHADLPAGTQPEVTGAGIRKTQQDLADQAQKSRSDLYKAVDPDDRLSVVTADMAKVGQAVKSSFDPNVSLSSPHSSDVVSMVANSPDVMPFNKVIELDKTITNKMAEAKRAGDYTGHGELRVMKDAVQTAINNALDNQHNWEQTAVQAGNLDPKETLANRLTRFGAQGPTGEGGGAGAIPVAATGTTGVPQEGVGERPAGEGLRGAQGDQGVQRLQPAATNFQGDLNNYTIFYPQGNLKARYELADAKDLITSHNTDFMRNPAYPIDDLQSRNRGGVESRNQINDIANKLNPEWLGPSPNSATGAPIVGPDNIVESGNGRTIAIMKAYESGKANNYRQWIENNGYDTSGMKQPILIARRTSDMTPEQRQRFADSSNSSTGLKMNASEQAESDAKMIAGMRNPLKPGEIGSVANRPFVQEFLSKLPMNERGDFVDADGAISFDGERRIAAAAARRAYGDSAVIDKGFMHKDNNMKSVTNGLIDASGPWHEMRQAAANGEIDPNHDVTNQVMDTFKQIMRAKDERKPLTDIFRQSDMFRAPETDAIRAMFSPDGVRLYGRDKIAAGLQDYAEKALQNRAGPSLFGEEAPKVTPKNILDTVVNKLEKTPEEVEPEAEAAPTQAVPEAQPQPTLTPNFDEAAANRLAQAKKAHADYVQTFRQGPIGTILKDNGFKGQYKSLDADVVGKAFPSGDKGYETTKAFIDASDQPGTDNVPAMDKTAETIGHLKDAAILRLRQMMGSSEQLTPKILQKWLQTYGGSLRALEERSPGFIEKYSNIADATDALTQAQALQTELTKQSQLGVAGKLINANTPDEVVSHVGRMIGATDGPTQINNLMQRINKSPALPRQEAIDGLRQAGVTHILNSIQNNGMAGEAHVLSSAKLRNFMNKNSDSIRALYGNDGYANMDRLARDMERNQQILDSVAVKGGSDTAQNKNFVTKLMGVAGHPASVGSAFMLAGIEAYDKLGWGGALAVGAAKAAQTAINSLRSHGVENVQKLYEKGLLDPKVGSALMQKAFDADGKIKVEALRRLANVVAASSRTALQSQLDQEAQRQDLLQRETLGRASGGRVFDISDRLVRAAEQAKKAESDKTEAILNVPDDMVAQALNVAQAAI